jgi:hypothetical protein
LAGETEVLGEKLPQCNLVHHKSYLETLLPSVTMTMEATGSSETLVPLCQTTRVHAPEDRNESLVTPQYLSELAGLARVSDVTQHCGVYLCWAVPTPTDHAALWGVLVLGRTNPYRSRSAVGCTCVGPYQPLQIMQQCAHSSAELTAHLTK